VSKETDVSALRSMLTIRRSEEHVVHFATDRDDLLRGHYHVYIGQEATGVGTCEVLAPDDYVFTTHRNHGHVIARGGDPGPVLAEIIGRTGGYNKGRGGTFHVTAPHLGILQTSAIVGGCVPLAAGAAFSIKTRGTDQVSLCFFGDGVMEEGAFHEGINMASLWGLPVIFMCENNSLPPARRSSNIAAKELVDVASALSIETHVVDGNDVRAVSALVAGLVKRTRKGEGPFFVESRINPWPGNGGQFPELIGGDYQLSWAWDASRADAKLQSWVRDADPISRFVRTLVEEGTLTQGEVEEIDADVSRLVAAAARFAVDSPEPSPESAMDHILA
jgi:TPP-dependent pyruvate/acetoin dehydrogenase alpha subunit